MTSPVHEPITEMSKFNHTVLCPRLGLSCAAVLPVPILKIWTRENCPILYQVQIEWREISFAYQARSSDIARPTHSRSKYQHPEISRRDNRMLGKEDVFFRASFDGVHLKIKRIDHCKWLRSRVRMLALVEKEVLEGMTKRWHAWENM